jgi:DNA-binding SARP family transcriptional activator
MYTLAQSVNAQIRAVNAANIPHTITANVGLPILICLLGNFCLLKLGHPVKVLSGGKVEALLCALALQPDCCLSREALLSRLWPDTVPTLAIQSLNSLIYSLHRRLGDAIGGAPVFHADGYYYLNIESGVGIDVTKFDSLADAGARQVQLGNQEAAVTAYCSALDLYRGDLCVGADLHATLERERLRTRQLTMLMYLADRYYNQGEYDLCLDYVRRLVDQDPCREDAHRLIMRCYVRQGQRAQALRQYRLCQDILRAEFDAVPERDTIALYDQIRLDSASV